MSAITKNAQGTCRQAYEVIKVNEPFAKDRAYVEPEDCAFVLDYIVSHCPNAREAKG